MVKRFFALLLVLSFFQPVAFADDTDQQPGGNIAIISKGKLAPWDGYLYDNFAFAKTQAETKVKDEQFQLKLKYELDTQAIRLKFATTTTAIALDSLRAEKKQTDKIRDDRVELCESHLVSAQDKADVGTTKLFVAGGVGVALGIGLAVLSAWAMGQVAAHVVVK